MINNQPIKNALNFHDLKYGKSLTNQHTRDQQKKIHFTKYFEPYLFYQIYILSPTFFIKPISWTLSFLSNLYLSNIYTMSRRLPPEYVDKIN
jgi:hypothetical protein